MSKYVNVILWPLQRFSFTDVRGQAIEKFGEKLNKKCIDNKSAGLKVMEFACILSPLNFPQNIASMGTRSDFIWKRTEHNFKRVSWRSEDNRMNYK